MDLQMTLQCATVLPLLYRCAGMNVKFILRFRFFFQTLFKLKRMSIFAKLFGKSSSEKPPTTQEAIQKLLEIEDLMVKRQGVLERKIEEELQTARSNGTKNKRRKSIYN